jgi:methyltransferase
MFYNTLKHHRISSTLFNFKSYIRTLIFPKHPDFKYVKGLPAFEAPHHVREEDVGKYREAIVVEKTKVLAGLTKQCFIDKELEPGTRVTLQLFPSGKNGKSVEATVVDPGYPREKDGVYWGYKTRLAERFSDIWTNCPYSDKYDFTAYVTDEEGTNIDSNDFSIPSFRHLLLVFGGEAIKNAMEADDRIVEKESISKLFNAHFNGCPNRFSKNVFLTELIPTSLSVLRKKFVENVAPTKPSISKKRRIIPKLKKNQ